jgi:hypothetical protein
VSVDVVLQFDIGELFSRELHAEEISNFPDCFAVVHCGKKRGVDTSRAEIDTRFFEKNHRTSSGENNPVHTLTSIFVSVTE